ncbi:nucleotide exchange factor GrpE [Paraferrimonas sedimenticola]|uniref:Protein GrpE n=1 Tax=Paraferrimonas sedimenticola TaxID=375674 RepID=A0AA37W204_9GAMM|nr:nucleotide exchange factor GrpE [Paraferrimonas sedimenticola]GLP97107.1 protein GrpE [Paraferrimonas sedimenticola]
MTDSKTEAASQDVQPEIAEENAQLDETQAEVEQEQAQEASQEQELDAVELAKQLAEAQATIAEQKDTVLRAKAEVDNIRRRAAIDVTKAKDFALEKFAKELLSVIDNLERALQGDADEATQAVREGVELTLKSFLSTVEKFGIKAIDPKGEAFNPEQHQAISMVPNPELPANTVMDVMQKGYELNGRLLRPAMVIVSQGG